MFVTTHRPPLNAAHSPDCYGCHLNSLTFDRGDPKKHVKKGDPWEGNPVKERIEELRAAGRRVAAYEIEHGLGDGSIPASSALPPTELTSSPPKE